MKFIIDRANLLAAMTRVSGVVGKSTIAVLNNVCIEAVDEAVTFRVTNLDMEAATTVPARVETSGAITVPAVTLREIAQNMADGADALFSMSADDPRLTVQSGRSRFKLPTLTPDNFPAMTTVGKGSAITIPCAQLAGLLDRVSFAAGLDQTRYVLTATHLFPHEGVMHAAATNIHKLAMGSIPVGDTFPKVMLPASFISEAVAMTMGADGDAILTVGKAKISVAVGNAVVISKLLDEAPLNYLGVIPRENPHRLVVDVDLLTLAVKRTLVMATNKERSIRVAVTKGAMAISAKADTSGEAADEIEAEYDGPDIVMQLSGANLLEVLAHVPTENVHIDMKDAKAPIVLTIPGNVSGVFVLSLQRG